MRKLLRKLVIPSGFTLLLLKALWFAESMDWIPADVQQFLHAIEVIVIAVIFVIDAVLQRYSEGRNDTLPANNRAVLIANVRNNWIKGMLEETLKDARFDIRVDTRATQAGDVRAEDYELPTVDREQPSTPKDWINAFLRRKTVRDPLVSTAQAIPQIFHDVSEKLLILGAPGSGKTVLLLELAKALLQAADNDLSQSVPVVFNLSSWAISRRPLNDWLADELQRNYGVDARQARLWIGSDSIIYLLDGLDEVAGHLREDCLNASNAFITTPMQIVICSRISEYETLSAKLNTHNAIELLPLDRRQVGDAISRHLPASTVRDVLQWISDSDAIWQEVTKPLFINILISTYTNGRPFSSGSLQAGTASQIQKLIIEPFVVQQLRNNPETRYANDDTLRYLAWIAYNLTKQNLSQFNIEMLQGDWLSTRNHETKLNRFFRPPYGRLTVDIGWRFEYIDFRENGCKEIFSTAVKRSLPSKSAILKLAFAFIILIPLGFPVPLFIGSLLAKFSFDVLSWLVNDLWPFGGRRVSHRSLFNQGFGDTFKLGLSFLFLISTIVGLIGSFAETVRLIGILDIELGLTLLSVATFAAELPDFAGAGFVQGFKYGFLFFFAINVIFGPWSNILKHVLLRVTLWRKGVAPGRYDKFLQMVVNRRLMRRVGGSVLFVHRYVLEYFADQWEQKQESEYERKRLM